VRGQRRRCCHWREDTFSSYKVVSSALNNPDDVLDSQFVCSAEEILGEFWECCERSRFCDGVVPVELREAAKALARMLEKNV
jgi:hypothetical protein